jgi:hypothetical protein
VRWFTREAVDCGLLADFTRSGSHADFHIGAHQKNSNLGIFIGL